MTSAINFSSINASYPVPGIDNDSQGFRDNFSAIANALSVDVDLQGVPINVMPIGPGLCR